MYNKERKDKNESRKRPVNKGSKTENFKKKLSTKPKPGNHSRIREEMRLNRAVANSGLCSRRDADDYITSGRVKVNGVVTTEMGTKVKAGDRIEVDNKLINIERKVYLLLNKPKDCITTSHDPEGRRTVFDYINGACDERIFPVGRLDRNTMGVLLLTNDGDMANRLTHPKYNHKKIYHVYLTKGITTEDIQKLVQGFELEDGFAKADTVEYVTKSNMKEIGIEIHSGKNRIVRRMIEHLGYEIEKLDRVYFAGLTKKDLPRGKWRFLNSKEIDFLKMQ